MSAFLRLQDGAKAMMRRSKTLVGLKSVRSLVCRDRRGNVAIEFGFMVPVFILLTLGAVELGRLGTEWSRLTHAAYSGVQYGIKDQANAANIPGMVQAARDDADDATNELSITARRYCQCPEAAVEVACSATCVDDKFTPMFVEVTATRDLAAIIPYADLPVSYPISVERTGRVR